MNGTRVVTGGEDAASEMRVPVGSPTLRRELGEEILVSDVMTGQMVTLNRSAVEVLDACDGRRSVVEIIELLAERHPIVPHDLTEQTIGALHALAEVSLVVWSDPETGPDHTTSPETRR